MREEIVASLESKSWWRSTIPSLKRKVLELPDDCNGFLEDLADRPEEIAGVRILCLHDLLVPDTQPIFGIFPVFQVQSLSNPSLVYFFQYFSWKQGPNSGSKGLLLIRRHGRISHVVFLAGAKFALGRSCFDTIGGFAEPDEISVEAMVGRFQKEILEETGLVELHIEEVIQLGRLNTDGGMTNNSPFLFAAVVSGNEATKLQEGDVVNLDPYELKGQVVIAPVEILPEIVAQNDDSFFLATCARLAQKGIVSLS